MIPATLFDSAGDGEVSRYYLTIVARKERSGLRVSLWIDVKCSPQFAALLDGLHYLIVHGVVTFLDTI